MSHCFISDLHLDASRPQITGLFLQFLRELPSDVESLFILGDLFEAWIGDDAVDELGQHVAEGIRGVADRGVAVRFMRGNRDFLLGTDYCSRAGMRLLPDACVLDVGGIATLLLHGDTLCTDDHAYQAFRRQVRDPAWAQGFLAQDVAQRIAFAKQARAASQRHQQQVDETITDVTPDEVAATFRRYGVTRIIHGHTHRPAIHPAAESCPGERIVLGDWYEQGSLLIVDGTGQAELSSLPS
ncbi:MAG: UDP-2,3-diacylglucosamine diphosphatase [Lysobacteraceae bacterium]